MSPPARFVATRFLLHSLFNCPLPPPGQHHPPRGSFNKTLADFGGDAGRYNAYLEEGEKRVAVLTSGTADQIAAVEVEIKRYEAEHQTSIAHNNQRRDASTASEEHRYRLAEAMRIAAASKLAVEEADKRRKAEAAKAALLAGLREEGLPDKTREEVRSKLAGLLDAAQRRASSGSGEGAGSDIPVATTLFIPAPTVALPAVVSSGGGGGAGGGGGIAREWGAAGLVGEVQLRWLREAVDETLFVLPR